MTDAPVIATIDGWALTEGLGPRVVAERAGDRLMLPGQAAIRTDGALQMYIGDRLRGRAAYDEIPRGVLVALVRDAIARGVLTVEELTTP